MRSSVATTWDESGGPVRNSATGHRSAAGDEDLKRRREVISEAVDRARKFLRGEQFSFKDAYSLWKDLKKEDELTLAWSGLERIRKENGIHLLDDLPNERHTLDELCQQQALLISKDQELAAATRHGRALKVLRERFVLDDPSMNEDSETLGIAGGIYKRKW